MALYVAKNLLEAIKAPSPSPHTPEPLVISNVLLDAIKLPFKSFNRLLLLLLLILLSTLTSFFLKSYPLPTVPIDPHSELSVLLPAAFGHLFFTYNLPLTLFALSCVIPIMIIRSLSDNPPSFTCVGLQRPFSTTIFVTLFYHGFSSLVGSLSGALKLTAGPDPIFPEVPSAVLSLLDSGYLKCFDVIFAVSLMISMEPEDGCFGLEAIYKAIEVVAGRKWEVAMLVSVEVLIVNTIAEISDVAVLVGAFDAVEEWPYVPILVQKAVFAVVGVFEIAVGMVLYSECKRRNVDHNGGGGNIRIVDDDGLMYESVPDVAPQLERRPVFP